MDVVSRRLGLEQEFFLVDERGRLSDRADEFLQGCWDAATAKGLAPECFAPEFVKHIIEINTVPSGNLTQLAEEYINTLQLALQVGQQLKLKLYPLSTYPLHVMPVIRDELNYHVQVRTVGSQRFENAGKCTGTHLHLEVPAGTIEPRVGVSYSASAAAQTELLNIYNLATALDAAIIALSRTCPFFEGRATGKAERIIHYRGSDRFGWEGVYTHLQPVGALMPYATSIENLVELQFHRHYSWLEAMDKAEVERHLFTDSGGNLLKSAWNPVRLNSLGTVELRGLDSNYPEVTLAVVAVIVNAANRVRNEGLTVKPTEGLRTFELNGTELRVPDFDYLNSKLLYAAVVEGVNNQEVRVYLDSVLKFVTAENAATESLAKLRISLDDYQTTADKLLEEFTPTTEQLSQEEGLQLVLQACQDLEEQVQFLAEDKLPPTIQT
jgi:hypothetical protein